MNDYIIDHYFDEYINTMMEIARLSENLKYYEEMFGDYYGLCISCGRYPPYIPSWCDTDTEEPEVI
jgi:hypothetical protein